METEATVEFKDYDVWAAVEDDVQEQITSFMEEHISEYDHASQGEEGFESQVYELLLDYKNGVKSCGTGKAFEEAVWKAMCRLDNPDTHDSVWAAAAKEYLLSVTPQTPRSQDVRAIVREELFNLGRLGQLRLTVYPPVFGADIAVAPGD
jgi:hypothetical protein|tara:strand:- start:386 stop:835 length:450 start_codon:yes stop_codon:yes gene_type:complete